MPSSEPDALAAMQTQVDSLNATVHNLADSLSARLDALAASLVSSHMPQLSSQTWLGPDVGQPQPGKTAGTRCTFQALGVADRTPGEHPLTNYDQGVSAPPVELAGPSAAPQPCAAPVATPQPSVSFLPLQPPPRYGDPPPQPSTSGWALSGPPPPRSDRGSRSSSESEDSEAESDISMRDSAASCLADFIYDVCPDSRPSVDRARPPRCGFEAWFGQPESAAARPRFRLYPRVAEVESEVAARAAALARRSNPLSQILPSRSRRYAIADQPLFAASLAVNPLFAQLTGARSVGSRRWGSITFSEIERLERLFLHQLEMTSSSLWLMSGILAMLKRDGFQLTDPTLFNAALSSASATLSQQARSSSAGSAFLRSKRCESLLAHTSLPVPEAQRRALTVSPGSEATLFDEGIFGDVVEQVQRFSLISSNLAVSRSLGNWRARSSFSSSPLVDPSAPGSSRAGRQHGKRSASSSRSGSRKRFRGGKGSAPSSKPSGFRKWEPSPYLTLSGGCLSLHWQAWRDRGVDPWVVEVLRYGCCIPFLRRPPLSKTPIPMPSYNPLSTKGVALGEVTRSLVALGAVELAPLPSPGFYSRLFVVWKTSGSWRPVIDLSTLNLFVDVSHFQMETIQSVLLSVCQGDWMASIDLKEAYLQIPVHPESRPFLRFVAHGRVHQFTALCFGLSTAPQVFTRAMAPVSAILHSWGICMRLYLDDWLVQSSSRDSLLRDLQVVLTLFHELGIVDS